MTAAEFLRFQLDDGTFQLKACLEPMNEEQLETKANPQGMTPRQTVEHLCECYEAYLASTEGREHEWGNYTIADKSKDSLLNTFEETRSRALTAASSADGEEPLRNAHMFLVAHDYYHVGQLCLVHLATDPEWDPYSIYSV